MLSSLHDIPSPFLPEPGDDIPLSQRPQWNAEQSTAAGLAAVQKHRGGERRRTGEEEDAEWGGVGAKGGQGGKGQGGEGKEGPLALAEAGTGAVTDSQQKVERKKGGEGMEAGALAAGTGARGGGSGGGGKGTGSAGTPGGTPGGTGGVGGGGAEGISPTLSHSNSVLHALLAAPFDTLEEQTLCLDCLYSGEDLRGTLIWRKSGNLYVVGCVISQSLSTKLWKCEYFNGNSEDLSLSQLCCLILNSVKIDAAYVGLWARDTFYVATSVDMDLLVAYNRGNLNDEMFNTVPKNTIHSNVFPEFLCPLSRNPMRQPCITWTGMSFEKSHVNRWLSHWGSDPVTRGRPESAEDMTAGWPNTVLEQVIAAWRTEHPWEDPSDEDSFRNTIVRVCPHPPTLPFPFSYIYISHVTYVSLPSVTYISLVLQALPPHCITPIK